MTLWICRRRFWKNVCKLSLNGKVWYFKYSWKHRGKNRMFLMGNILPLARLFSKTSLHIWTFLCPTELHYNHPLPFTPFRRFLKLLHQTFFWKQRHKSTSFLKQAISPFASMISFLFQYLYFHNRFSMLMPKLIFYLLQICCMWERFKLN